MSARAGSEVVAVWAITRAATPIRSAMTVFILMEYAKARCMDEEVDDYRRRKGEKDEGG